MSKKEITMKEFANELTQRLKNGKTVDCCKDELINLAAIIEKKIPDEKITVSWKD